MTTKGLVLTYMPHGRLMLFSDFYPLSTTDPGVRGILLWWLVRSILEESLDLSNRLATLEWVNRYRLVSISPLFMRSNLLLCRHPEVKCACSLERIQLGAQSQADGLH